MGLSRSGAMLLPNQMICQGLFLTETITTVQLNWDIGQHQVSGAAQEAGNECLSTAVTEHRGDLRLHFFTISSKPQTFVERTDWQARVLATDTLLKFSRETQSLTHCLFPQWLKCVKWVGPVVHGPKITVLTCWVIPKPVHTWPSSSGDNEAMRPPYLPSYSIII